ncbi:hypothetical protein ACFY1U_35225 [Streptomyces sp. NPDC001351]|uniref:hypothetical protein n=1 Tax=unclassified Streptomyces TaxID=2593676 RepID=UPI003684E728
MAVRARIEGHVFDLDTLCELFADGEPRVSKESDGYYLASDELDGLINEGGRLLEAASLVLRRVVGVARALDSRFRPVALTGQFTDDSGNRHHVAVLGTAEERVKAFDVAVVKFANQSSPPVQQPPPPPQGPLYMELIKTHSDVAEVLGILGKPSVSMTWVDLYKVYEIVRHNVGNDKALRAKGWVPDSDISAFTGSANRPDVSGSEARHARLPGASPKRTMKLTEGEAFIRTLVVAWWDSLSPSS